MHSFRDNFVTLVIETRCAARIYSGCVLTARMLKIKNLMQLIAWQRDNNPLTFVSNANKGVSFFLFRRYSYVYFSSVFVCIFLCVYLYVYFFALVIYI